jgi:hypothetical protein
MHGLGFTTSLPSQDNDTDREDRDDASTPSELQVCTQRQLEAATNTRYQHANPDLLAYCVSMQAYSFMKHTTAVFLAVVASQPS